MVANSPGVARRKREDESGGNAWNLSAERQKQRRDLCAQYTNLGRAMTLRETQQAIYASPDYGRLHLQHWRQPSRTGPRRGDFSACPITQPYAVKTVTIMNSAFDCLKVHDGMPSDLDERIAAQPSQEVSHGIKSGKLFAHGMDPGAPFPSQHRYDLTAGEQPELVPIHILDWKQLVGCTSKTHLVRCWDSVPEIAGAGRRASFKWPKICQQPIDSLRDLLRIQGL